MEYQKLINLLGNTTNQISKFRTENWVEITDRNGVYSSDEESKFKTSMLKSSLRGYSDAYILVKGTISVTNTAGSDADANNTNIKVIFKNCAPFQKYKTEINNTQVGKGQDIDVVMHSLQTGTKSHLKKQSHLKSQFPLEVTVLMFLQNFQSHLKSNALFTLMLNICFKKFSRLLESR